MDLDSLGGRPVSFDSLLSEALIDRLPVLSLETIILDESDPQPDACDGVITFARRQQEQVDDQYLGDLSLPA